MNEPQKQVGIQFLNFFVPFGGTMLALLIGFVELQDINDHMKPGNEHHPPAHYEEKIDERYRLQNKEIERIQRILDRHERRLDKLGG